MKKTEIIENWMEEQAQSLFNSLYDGYTADMVFDTPSAAGQYEITHDTIGKQKFAAIELCLTEKDWHDVETTLFENKAQDDLDAAFTTLEGFDSTWGSVQVLTNEEYKTITFQIDF